jgi:hypothetical protein
MTPFMATTLRDELEQDLTDLAAVSAQVACNDCLRDDAYLRHSQRSKNSSRYDRHQCRGDRHAA